MNPTEQALRDAVEAICHQLCRVAAGDLDVRLAAGGDDFTAQKLSMLGNSVLHVARRAVAEARAKQGELAAAQEIARLGTIRVEVDAGLETWRWSDELHRVLGTDPERFVASREAFFRLVHCDDVAAVEAAFSSAVSGLTTSIEWRAVCPDDTTRHVWTELRPVLLDRATVAVDGVFQDVTDRRLAEARIRYLAEHDSLTGLANRDVLREHIERAIRAPARTRSSAFSTSVLCIDLDGFKAVNDQFGHAAGDRILIEAARRMKRTTRGSDVVARLGGDEFAVVQTRSDQPKSAERLASRLLRSLSQPYLLADGLETNAISASIGIAASPGDGETVDALLAASDAALYRAKAAGRNRAVFFHPEMERETRERRALEADLRCAIDRGELSIDYQPLADVGSTRTVGFEALLRWNSRVRGPIAPDVFIPVAEASGTIQQLGEWVLQRACEDAASWDEPLFVAVNVSPLQVQRGRAFADFIERVLARTGLAPTRLELEVTEGVVLQDTEATLAALSRVREFGVRIALDDFGTGYSSLATLQAFPFDKIKVDRRFVAGLGGGSEQDAAIVRAVLGLARGLDLPVVAEGVETLAQLRALRLEGCSEVQGWLIGRPGPAETVRERFGVRIPSEMFAPDAAHPPTNLCVRA